MNIFFMPSILDMEHACYAPAPPNILNAWFFGLYPLAYVKDRIGLAIASLDTLMKPRATSCIESFGPYIY
jgi:hypothetical protein